MEIVLFRKIIQGKITPPQKNFFEGTPFRESFPGNSFLGTFPQ
jgi:hypothetical protein